ncbi:MAG TPA: hypothetical protein VMV56_03620 [Williamwhitmania sp.]|nr:hypothetical protein [Williamwhitmania sp.]
MIDLKSNRQVRFLADLMGVVIFICVIYYFNRPEESTYQSNLRYCAKKKEKTYNGVIVRLYYSGGPVYVLKDSTLFSTLCAERNNRIHIGDSIYKPSGTFSYYIYRKANPDSVIFVKCDFDCNSIRKTE